MSTRCNILVRGRGRNITLYHHHDGYPEGVGLDLKRRFFEKDWNAYAFANALVKDTEDEYEVCFAIDSDIDYLYIVDFDKREIRCFYVDPKDFTFDGKIDARIICQSKNRREIPEE